MSATMQRAAEPRAAPRIPMLEVRGVGKRFNGVIALEDVSFDVAAGEIVALLGENGAGKSTLIKILAGVHAPSSGTLLFRGAPTDEVENVGQLFRYPIFIYERISIRRCPSNPSISNKRYHYENLQTDSSVSVDCVRRVSARAVLGNTLWRHGSGHPVFDACGQRRG